MESVYYAYRVLLWLSAGFLATSICACLARAVLGPSITDRIVSINVICTKAVILIAVFSCLFEDKNLLDVAIVYAMISFLAVVVLSKCYILPHHINPADLDYDPETGRLRNNASEEVLEEVFGQVPEEALEEVIE